MSGFAPASGPPGTSVTITGTNLGGATAVSFNGTVGIIVTNSATTITTTVPSAATSGTITVTTAGGSATSPASFTVTSPPPPYTVCASGCPYSDLTAAFTAAPAGDTITIGPGSYSLTVAVDKNITFRGAGAAQTFLKNPGAKGFGVFYTLLAAAGTNVSASAITFDATYSGVNGVIANSGTMTLDDVVVANGSGVFTGGISNSGTMTLNRSLVTHNFSDLGGGIINTGAMTVNSSTISGNSAGLQGGGILNRGTLTLDNSTVTGNNYRNDNGGNNGGGIYNDGGSVTLTGTTTVTGNTPVDCVGLVCP